MESNLTIKELEARLKGLKAKLRNRTITKEEGEELTKLLDEYRERLIEEMNKIKNKK